MPMLEDLGLDLAAWWATVPPEFAFLLALPFGVAALGLFAGRRKAARRRDEARGGPKDRPARPGQPGQPRWLGPAGKR